VDVDARWTILASGGAGEVLRAFEVATRDEASGTAARLYLRVPESVVAELPFLLISFSRDTAPGYGWLFPGPGGILNAGVGVFHDARRRSRHGNLRSLMTRFLSTFPPARMASRAAQSRSPLMGARLRTGLTGCRPSRPGLLVAGEALGATYSLTGEGIGKALETGIMAADAAHRALEHGSAPAEGAIEYARRLDTQFRDRFRAYALAQNCLEYPAVGNFLAWRANAGSFVRSQLTGLFNETVDPKTLFSARGLLTAMFR
jgi:flavin-dependent dehydrogenase